MHEFMQEPPPNCGPLPSSSAKTVFHLITSPCPTDTIAYKPKQLQMLGVTQGASNKQMKGTCSKQK